MSSTSQVPYVIDGEWVIPGESAAGGWDTRLQSGHVLSPLLAHLVEQVPTLTPMLTTRCIVDLTRAVPRKPLRWRCEVVRQGKKLQIVRAALFDDDLELASLTALRARIAESPVVPAQPYPGPEGLPKLVLRKEVEGYDIRVLDNAQNGAGNCKIWTRLDRGFVEGVAPSPFTHAMSLADFGNGMANAISLDDWNFPNIDIVVLFFRQPQGEWLLLDAVTETAGNGLAVVSGVLADRQGPFARSHQTLFIDPAHIIDPAHRR